MESSLERQQIVLKLLGQTKGVGSIHSQAHYSDYESCKFSRGFG
jgi:hypothetical protein